MYCIYPRNEANPANQAFIFIFRRHSIQSVAKEVLMICSYVHLGFEDRALLVITGRGQRSRDGRAVLKEAVVEYLERKHYELVELTMRLYTYPGKIKGKD